MKSKGGNRRPLSADDDIEQAPSLKETAQTASSSYTLSYADRDFLVSDEVRGVRLMLEDLKPELVMQQEDIESTVVVFGSARIPAPETGTDVTAESSPLQHYYDEARRFGRLLSEFAKSQQPLRCVVMTGGGPGIMEAANRGASDVDAKSIGLNIVLPKEQAPNVYSTPELSFQFHYFALRKLHFLLRAKALVVFPGGFGTLDELFETLTLLQTRRIHPMPVLLFGKPFWDKIVDFEALVEFGVIERADLDLFHYVDSAEQAVEIIRQKIDSEPNHPPASD